MHRCIHAVNHLIEDHAARAGLPVRFAATKLVEGDPLIEKALDLDENEKELLGHTIAELESETGLDREAALADMRFNFTKSTTDSVGDDWDYSNYTIKATAGAGGSISPSGDVSVREGEDQTFKG